MKTPELEALRRSRLLAKAISDLTTMHETLLRKVEQVKVLVEEHKRENALFAERIKKLPKGDKGDKGDAGKDARGIQGKKGDRGDDGYTPVKGEDYFTKEDIEEVAITAANILRDEEDDGEEEESEDEKLEKLLEKIREKLTWKDIKGLENEISSYRNQLAGKKYGKDTWARGSGTTVSAGSNITLVPQADGTVQINASGGGSGTDVTTQYALTAVQAGSDVTIDLTQLSNWATFVDLIALYRNNLVQTEGASYNFTVTGSTVTVFNADASDIFNITYSYT